MDKKLEPKIFYMLPAFEVVPAVKKKVTKSFSSVT